MILDIELAPDDLTSLYQIIDKLIVLDKKISIDQEKIGRNKLDPYVYICDYQRTGISIKTVNICILKISYVEPIEGILNGFYLMTYSTNSYVQINTRIISMGKVEIDEEIFETADDLIKMLEKIYKNALKNYREVKNLMV